ncbi:MAG: hypothetical protein JWP87_2586 [Labilithrix sp.]|jgi:hypothetical protein|nr:hypothetical protein [Labilithrix sp.]
MFFRPRNDKVSTISKTFFTLFAWARLALAAVTA